MSHIAPIRRSLLSVIARTAYPNSAHAQLLSAPAPFAAFACRTMQPRGLASYLDATAGLGAMSTSADAPHGMGGSIVDYIKADHARCARRAAPVMQARARPISPWQMLRAAPRGVRQRSPPPHTHTHTRAHR